MKQKILVAVTGMSPQIVTETVYALHKNHDWLPEKIVVLTTLRGKNQIVQQLLGENGYFARLRQDYALPEIEFTEQNIKVISEHGTELDDIRTAQQNNAAADLIVREIYQLCQDKNTELHVSIAGGRKSMGFYVGYALSLFGRAQDKMSHVLVEEDFEQNREFFYPPKQSQFLNTPNKGMLDASKAEVMLAEIPFVRMAEGRVELKLDGKTTFSQAVQKTQEVLNGVNVVVNKDEQTVSIISKADDKLLGKVKLPAQRMALYLAVRDFCQQGRDVISNNNEIIKDFAECYMKYYQQYKHELHGSGTHAVFKRNEQIEALTKNYEIFHLLKRELTRLNEAFLNEFNGEYGLQFGIQSDKNYGATRYFVNYID